jgi:DNA-binding MarR family transcriptional regulator
MPEQLGILAAVTAQPPPVDRDVLTLAWLARVLERACTDLTLPQYRLLAFIAGGDERASDVADRLSLARPTVSATIDTLVERGLLERTAVDTDRRAVRLTITSDGARAMGEAQAAMRERLEAVLAHADDRPALAEALGQLSAAMVSERAARREVEGERSAGERAVTVAP